MREGASALLVDCLGHAAVKTLGPSSTGVSLEINLSFFDAACLDVSSTFPFFCFFDVHHFTQSLILFFSPLID